MTMSQKTKKTEAEWKQDLTPIQFHVLREKGTERPFTGEYDGAKEAGVYRCAGCGTELFRSDAKFDSGSGWPSFYEPADGENVKTETDRSFLMRRTEVLCATCHSHLGHLFDDAPQTPTGDRYCINSVSIRLAPAE